MKKIDPVLISVLKNIDPKVLAKDICDTQPISPETISTLFESSKSEKWLKENGYEPICESTKIMWVKK